jgi:hypothetical protein
MNREMEEQRERARQQNEKEILTLKERVRAETEAAERQRAMEQLKQVGSCLSLSHDNANPLSCLSLSHDNDIL